MLKYFFHKIKNSKFTLRACVVFVLIAFLIIALSIILPLAYFRLYEDLKDVSYQFMSRLSSQIYYRISDEIDNIEIAGKFSTELINRDIVDSDNQQELIDYLVSLMKVETQTVESVQSAFWGDELGNFIMAEKQEDGSILTEVINRTISPVGRRLIYRDVAGNVTHTMSSKDMSYDPRIRPWYLVAKNAKKPQWTDIYPYRLTGFLGTTYTTPIYKNEKLQGVFILNVRIDFLRRFIENIQVSKHGLAFLTEDDGKIVAYPGMRQYDQKTLLNIDSLKNPALVASFEKFKQHGPGNFDFKINGKTYISVYKKIQSFGSHTCYIGIVVPESDFTDKYEGGDIIVIWIACLVLLIGVVALYFFLARVMRPIQSLIAETEKIKNFDLKGNTQVRSRIQEIFQLSQAIESMKKGLRSFQKYVPATLVRQLIEAGEDVRIGGVRKQLAIFFSDIKDFTKISEHADPNKLTTHICEYFEELSNIIVKERGTIDKYIGDSIMAIWGAPLPEAASCEQAAKAAIACEERLRYLNKRWQRQGKATFFTRIGLHIGDAVVGNVGSSERVSYTAIGDAINMASRLEGLNKLYGTQIMVSAAFYEAVKHQFIFRLVDKVTLKGKEETSYVYELLAGKNQSLPFDVEAYQDTFKKGFAAYANKEWDEALLHFTECLSIYPEDTVAHTFIKRCKHFKRRPPEDWDGVWHIN